MNIRLTSFLLLVLSLSLISLSCSSTPEDGDMDIAVEPEAGFLSRPFLEKAVQRPLSRVLVSWSAVDGATGYLLQMSGSENFSEIRKSWTISGRSLELPIEPGDELWFRVRSFDSNTSSRWSSVLEVKEEKL